MTWAAAGQPAGVTHHAAAAAGLLALFVAGLKGGLLTFGGAYTAIPYVRADTVGARVGFPTARSSTASRSPGCSRAAGHLRHFRGLCGRRPGRCGRDHGRDVPPRLRLLARAVRAAGGRGRKPDAPPACSTVWRPVVGIIAATFVELGASTIHRTPVLWPVVVIFAAAAVAAWRLKGRWVTPVLVLFGAAAGWATIG